MKNQERKLQYIFEQKCGKPQKDEKNKYELGKFLYRQSQWYCYQVRKIFSQNQKNLGQIYTLKISRNKQNLNKQLFDNEIKVLKELQNLNNDKFPKLISKWEDQKAYYILLQRNLYGNLQQLASQLSYFLYPEILYIMKEIFKAVDILHDNNIYHRNLTLASIIIDENFNIKIDNFGLSKLRENSQFLNLNRMGNPNYKTEQFFEEEYIISEKDDIFSLGVIAYLIGYLAIIQQINNFPRNKIIKAEGYKVQLNILNSIGQLKVCFILFQKRGHLLNIYYSKGYLEISLIISNKNQQPNSKDILIVRYQLVLIGNQNQFKIIDKIEQKINLIKIRKLQFGYFILLSNLNYIGYFHDQKIITFKQSMIQSTIPHQKVLAVYYQTYFKQLISKEYNSQQINESENSCRIKKIIKINKSVFIRLTNSVLQIFFQQQNRQFQQINAIRYQNSVWLNYDQNSSSLVKFKSIHNQQIFDSFQVALASNKKQFIFINKAIKIILQDSIITIQK